MLFQLANCESMKLCLSIILLLLIGTNARCQDLGIEVDSSDRFDVYLKNGVVLKSVTLDFEPRDQLKVHFPDGQFVYVRQGELKRIKAAKGTKRQAYFDKIKRRDFYSIIDMGLMFAHNRGGGNPIALSVQTIHGHRFKHYLHLGLGIGIDLYEGYRTLPIFVNLRGDILEEAKIMPYYYASLGYSHAWSVWQRFDEINGGPTFDLGVGLKFPANNKAWLLGIGHRSQYLRTQSGNFEQWGWEEDEKRRLRRLEISFGVTF